MAFMILMFDRPLPGSGCVGKCVCENTNLQNKGLISVDRSNKATLLLTIPRSLFKSSAKDLSPPIFEIVIRCNPSYVGPPSCMI